MRLRTILSCCVLLLLGAAVFQKSREVAGLKEANRNPEIREAPSHPLAASVPIRGSRREGKVSADEANPFSETFALGARDELSPEAIRILNLADEEVATLNELIRRFRGEAAQDLVKRLKLAGSRSGDGSLHQRYHARARRDRGQAYLDALSLEFGSIIGQDRSRQLIKGLRREEEPARLGRLDLELEVTRARDGSVRVSHQCRNPKSGEVTSFGESDLVRFEEEHGKLFEVPEVE